MNNLMKKLITKSKCLILIVTFSFILFIVGLLTGAIIQQRHCAFWSSLVDQDHIEQVEELIEQNEAMVNRLIQLKNAIDDYRMPQSSPDVARISRKE